MRTRPQIINNRVVNFVEQLARFLKPGDFFRVPKSSATYLFKGLDLNEGKVNCENMVTKKSEHIYYNSPVFKIMAL